MAGKSGGRTAKPFASSDGRLSGIAAWAVVAAVAAAVWMAVAWPGAASADEIATDRLAGVDRVETAVAISEHAFPGAGDAEAVFLARSDEFADAVAAGPLTGGPVLLVPSCGEVPDAVAGEIDRLDPDEVIALGGEAAVCDELLSAAAGERASGRIAGDTRFATAVAISQTEFPEGAEEVYVANAFDAPDAVAGGGSGRRAHGGGRCRGGSRGGRRPPCG